MAGNVLIKNANGSTVTLQNPDTNVADVVVDTSKIMQKTTSTDKAIPRFNGTTGDVQNSNVIISDNGNVTIATTPSGNFAIETQQNYLGTARFGSCSIGRSGSGYPQTGYNFICTSVSNVFNYDVGNSASALRYTSGGFEFYSAPVGVAGNPITFTEVMGLDMNGNLTLGSAAMSGARALSVSSGTLANNEASTVQASGGTAGVNNRGVSIMAYKHAGIVNACGAVQIAQQNGTYQNIWVDDVAQLRIGGSTQIGTTAGTIIGTQTSDERVKNIAGACPYGLQEILELETYKYSMKDDVEDSFKLGFVAQQAMGVIPESVYDTGERLTKPATVIKQKVVKEAIKDEEGNILEPEVLEDYEDVEYQETSDTVTKLAMDYQMMIPVLVNAMKEQQALINNLKTRLDMLEGAN